MVTYTYTTVDGQRVETHVAAAFARMAHDFQSATGKSLHVSNGTRTYQEQVAIFLARYVTAGNVKGRKVYDVRVWNGTAYYRISSAGTVAQPGTSNHEEDGPNGPRSIDIYDSGSDAGVTVRNTARDNWMAANAGNYQFENEGYNFGEPWHKTFRGAIGDVTPPPPTPTPPNPNQRPVPWSVVQSWPWNGVAAMLRKYYGYVGNNTPGPVMMKSFQKFLNAGGYAKAVFGRNIAEDGQYGDESAKAHQMWLKQKYGYTGAIDAWMGTGSYNAHVSANNANWNAFPQNRQ
jgi:hypothetical protein